MFKEETSRKLIIEMCVNKLKEDIEHFKLLLNSETKKL